MNDELSTTNDVDKRINISPARRGNPLWLPNNTKN